MRTSPKHKSADELDVACAHQACGKDAEAQEKRAAGDENVFREAVRRPKKQIIKKKKNEDDHRNGVWDLQALYI